MNTLLEFKQGHDSSIEKAFYILPPFNSLQEAFDDLKTISTWTGWNQWRNQMKMSLNITINEREFRWQLLDEIDTDYQNTYILIWTKGFAVSLSESGIQILSQLIN